MLNAGYNSIRQKMKSHKSIVENFFSLSVLNAISFIFPLITVPYLTRVLGPTTFGVVSFALVVVQYFVIFTNFGFAYSATQQISVNQHNREKISDIFSAVIPVKFMISVICGLVLLGMIVFLKQFRSDYLVFIFSFGIVIGDALVPVWLFQGMEKMKFITLVNFISKFTFTLLIFVFVRSESDYLIVPLFNTCGYLIAGLISFFIAYRTFRLKVVMPKISEIRLQLKESWPIFISTFSINLYRNANVLLLGLMTNYTITGYYASAEKVIKGMQSIITPLSDALFPFVSKRFANDGLKQNISFITRAGKYYFIILSAIAVVFVVFAGPIVTVFLGNEYIPSIPDMELMGFVILFGGLNYLLGIVGLINMGFKKKFMIFVTVTGLISIVNLCWLIPLFQDRGASLSMLLSELVLFIMLLIYFIKLKKENG
jgi:polysaccharide transporter, PST family